jgi:hypothetical protein
MGRMFEFQDWKEDMLECWNIGILLDPTRFRFKRLHASINPSFQYSIYAVLFKKGEQLQLLEFAASASAAVTTP